MGAALATREILTPNPHSALRAATRGSERLGARRRVARRRRIMSRVDVRDRVVVVMRRMRTDCERQGAYPRELRGWVPPIVGAVRLEWVSGPMRRVYGECAAIAAVDVIVAQHAAVSSDDFDCALERMRAPHPIASSIVNEFKIIDASQWRTALPASNESERTTRSPSFPRGRDESLGTQRALGRATSRN